MKQADVYSHSDERRSAVDVTLSSRRLEAVLIDQRATRGAGRSVLSLLAREISSLENALGGSSLLTRAELSLVVVASRRGLWSTDQRFVGTAGIRLTMMFPSLSRLLLYGRC